MHRHVVAVLVMLIVVVSVTMHYSNYDTTTGWGKLLLQKRWGKKRASQSERWREDLTPIYFWMKSPGLQALPPISLSENVCPHGGCRQKEYDHRICWGYWQPSPERDLWEEIPAIELLTHETTQEEIMGIYHQVYQLKRKPREEPCSQDMAEETCIETLEMLKECLWHRWGLPSQRSWGEGLQAPEPLGCLLRWNSMPRCRWPMTILATFRTGSRSPRMKP